MTFERTVSHAGVSPDGSGQAGGLRSRGRAPLEVVVIGAGPAGLTAACQLGKVAGEGDRCVVLEADSVVGGISRTVERDGWRFDIGGHRFFTKVPAVEALWSEILPDEDFLRRPRLSRIYYDGKFFDYPLRPFNALKGLGPVEALRCGLSYASVRLRPPSDTQSFEGWTASRFGWRLYRKFFKTYTEKVWGTPANEIEADWAAQRIKSLTLGKAVARAVLPAWGREEITSLIEEFRYPKHGPGMMWERARLLAEQMGSEVVLSAPVVRVHHERGLAVSVTALSAGAERTWPATHVVSSMPLGSLVKSMSPAPPQEVLDAADGLRHRDFLTVALVVPAEGIFRDNWIYVHSPGVRVGRIQNFGSWSPYMVQDDRTCLGLEYFVFEGDELWSMDDASLVALASRELDVLGLASREMIEAGYVVRMPKAYPVYDGSYRERVQVLRTWLEAHAPNVYPVGRNGMHKYNNQDHSMYTAMLSVENIFGAHHDVWSVNVEDEYHEESLASRGGQGLNEGTDESVAERPNPAWGADRTGRSAPILVSKAPAQEP